MLLILGVAAAIGAAFLAARWQLHSYDSLGRRRRFPTISVSLLTVLAIALALPTFLRHREEAKLDKVATVIVGAHATVHCETLGQEFTDLSGDLGFVKFGDDGVPEHHTTIMRGPCADLKHYYGGDQAHPSPDEIIAVHVLTHESMHMRGQPVEALAECEAMQRDAETAQLLGATPQEGLALARDYWLVDYPNMPDNYRTGDCALNGKLDEHLPDPPWTRGDYPAVILPAAG
ncbi:MAG TPA: hypothetical protein VHW74_13890 [Mycobacteriales bacterium]|nr:hypothetical protein [Mycobacteriales bacterium]